MLRILIVEDEPLFGQTLRHLVELNPLYRVTAIAEGRQVDPDFTTGARVQELVAAAVVSANTDGSWQPVPPA